MRRGPSISTSSLVALLLLAPMASAQDAADHVEFTVSESCQTGIGTIDISITPLGNTQIPGPPGITILQAEDTGVKWQTPIPFFIESPADYFPEPPKIQLSYLAGPQQMPALIADFAYCPTVEQCLFATEQIEIQTSCQ